MTIAMAIQRGNQVYVYGKDGTTISMIDGMLQSYTSDTITVKRGKHIYVSNPKGQNVRSYPA